MSMRMNPTFGSLFAGIGGFDMGMEQAGWECKFQVEWDKHCTSVLEYHWADVPKWGDVSQVNGAEIPPVDCIIFGSPCQDLSVSGKRAGLEGERSGLFHEAVRIIKEMRDVTNGTFPRWAIWENVAGALSSNAGQDFATVINEMAKAGAVLQEFAVLDAQHFGVPQQRRRVFLVACFDPATAFNCPDPLLPVSESVRRDSAKGKSKRQTSSRTLTEGVGGDGAWWDGGHIAETLTTTSNQQRMPDKNRFQAVVQQKTFTESSDWSLVPVGVEWFSDAGVPWDGQPTESMMVVRRLTPLECERLMGYPDDHTRWKADGSEQADTHRYKQCGNGVATPVAKWVGQQVLKAHETLIHP